MIVLSVSGQDDTLVYNNHGTAKGQLGHYAAAIADYDMAIHLNPDFAEVYDGRGASKDKTGSIPCCDS